LSWSKEAQLELKLKNFTVSCASIGLPGAEVGESPGGEGGGSCIEPQAPPETHRLFINLFGSLFGLFLGFEFILFQSFAPPSWLDRHACCNNGKMQISLEIPVKTQGRASTFQKISVQKQQTKDKNDNWKNDTKIAWKSIQNWPEMGPNRNHSYYMLLHKGECFVVSKAKRWKGEFTFSSVFAADSSISVFSVSDIFL
jgi:hypothetical protein